MKLGNRVEVIDGGDAGLTGTITRNPESGEWHDGDDSVWVTFDDDFFTQWFEIERLKICSASE